MHESQNAVPSTTTQACVEKMILAVLMSAPVTRSVFSSSPTPGNSFLGGFFLPIFDWSFSSSSMVRLSPSLSPSCEISSSCSGSSRFTSEPMRHTRAGRPSMFASVASAAARS